MTALELGLGALKLAAMVPPIASWLKEVTRGRTDEISLRVAQILPEVGESETALKEYNSLHPPDTKRGS